LFSLVRPSSTRDRDFADEISGHLQLHIDDNIRSGLTPGEARRVALATLGGRGAVTQAHRERRAFPLVDRLAQDLRFAFRQLRRHPGFSVAAVFVMAVGMFAAVTIFAMVDAALIRPLPYPKADRLVEATEAVAGIPRANLSYLDYLDWKQMNTVFTSLEVSTGGGFLLSTPAGAEPVRGARVSAGFFQTLGVPPALGRDFQPSDVAVGAAKVAMITHASWRKRFDGRPDIIGQTARLDGIGYEVIGVLPANFEFAPRTGEIFTPIDPSRSCERRRGCHNLKGLARLRDDVSIDTASIEMAAIARKLEVQYPDSNRGQGAVVTPLSEVVVGEVRPVLLVLLAGAGLLLLIATTNVASLVLVRADRRRREMALRRALGASGGHLAVQFVVEALLLVGLAVALAMTTAAAMLDRLPGVLPASLTDGLPFLANIGLNWRVVIVTLAIGVTASLLFSVIPALRVSPIALRGAMADGGRGSSHAWKRLGGGLVTAELTIAVILLAAAGLLSKSAVHLLGVEVGFNPGRLATFEIIGPSSKYEGAKALALSRDLTDRLRRLPGVESIGLTGVLPVSFNGNTTWIRIVGKPYDGAHNEVNVREISAGYFQTIQATVLKGRSFLEADDVNAPKVIVINDALARRYFPNENPIGQRIGDTGLSPDSIAEVVGVVGDIREGPLDADIWPAVYVPFSQNPGSNFIAVLRASRDERAVLGTAIAAVRELDPEIGVRTPATMADRIAESPAAFRRRSTAWLVSACAGVALVLSMVGLYSVMAYLVGQRTREIGVRVALGAPRGSVRLMVVRESAVLAVAGLATGLAFAVGLATLMRSLLFAIEPWDVATLGSVAVLLLIAVLVASYVPARRAASIDPIVALRAE
jgi:macrolide transport system ATP-binding/permease protein